MGFDMLTSPAVAASLDLPQHPIAVIETVARAEDTQLEACRRSVGVSKPVEGRRVCQVSRQRHRR